MTVRAKRTEGKQHAGGHDRVWTWPKVAVAISMLVVTGAVSIAALMITHSPAAVAFANSPSLVVIGLWLGRQVRSEFGD